MTTLSRQLRHDWRAGDPIRLRYDGSGNIGELRGRRGEVTRVDGPNGMVEVRITTYVFVDRDDLEPLP